MPRFTALRTVLRGSKDTTSTSTSTSAADLSPASSTTAVSASVAADATPAAMRAPIVFASLHNRPGLISLAEAQRTPAIVYHSVSALPEPEPEPEFPAHDFQMKLVPLAVAAARRDIKYRREGFEMMEARAHIAAVRAELF